MNTFFDRFQGGILVAVKTNNVVSFYYGDNSWWLMDDWESNILNGSYFNEIEPLIVEFHELKINTVSSNNYLPSFYMDFDNKAIYNNFYDQALETRIIEGWSGFFIENKNEFLFLIPKEFHYWDNNFSTNNQ